MSDETKALEERIRALEIEVLRTKTVLSTVVLSLSAYLGPQIVKQLHDTLVPEAKR